MLGKGPRPGHGSRGRGDEAEEGRHGRLVKIALRVSRRVRVNDSHTILSSDCQLWVQGEEEEQPRDLKSHSFYPQEGLHPSSQLTYRAWTKIPALAQREHFPAFWLLCLCFVDSKARCQNKWQSWARGPLDKSTTNLDTKNIQCANVRSHLGPQFAHLEPLNIGFVELSRGSSAKGRYCF